jgi:hypothetical protein
VSNVTRVSPLKTAHSNAFANPSSIGSNAIIAAVAGARIRVLSVVMVSTLANSVKFMSAATDISATFPLAANGGLVLPFNEHGWFETVVGEALNLNMTAATATGTQIHYILLLA